MLLHLLRTPNHTPYYQTPSALHPHRVGEMGVMLTMLRERGIQRGRGVSIFPLQQRRKSEEPPPPPTSTQTDPAGQEPPTSSSDPRLPYLSTATSRASRRRRERQRAARCHRMLQWRRGEQTHWDLWNRERKRVWFITTLRGTKILRILMILLHITMNASGSFIITLMVSLGLE